MFLLLTVVRVFQYYYHLTTIDCIDLPYYAVSVTVSQIFHRCFSPENRDRIRLFRRLIALD